MDESQAPDAPDVFLSGLRPAAPFHRSTPIANQNRWHDSLRRYLEVELATRLSRRRPDGTSGVNVFLGPALIGESLAWTLERTVRRSKTFVAVLTDEYFDNEWCRKELMWFLNELSQQSADSRSPRLFPLMCARDREGMKRRAKAKYRELVTVQGVWRRRSSEGTA